MGAPACPDRRHQRSRVPIPMSMPGAPAASHRSWAGRLRWAKERRVRLLRALLRPHRQPCIHDPQQPARCDGTGRARRCFRHPSGPRARTVDACCAAFLIPCSRCRTNRRHQYQPIRRTRHRHSQARYRVCVGSSRLATRAGADAARQYRERRNPIHHCRPRPQTRSRSPPGPLREAVAPGVAQRSERVIRARVPSRPFRRVPVREPDLAPGFRRSYKPSLMTRAPRGRCADRPPAGRAARCRVQSIAESGGPGPREIHFRAR